MQTLLFLTIYLSGAVLSFARINAFYSRRVFLTYNVLRPDLPVVVFLALLSWIGLAIGLIPYFWIEDDKDKQLFNFNIKDLK